MQKLLISSVILLFSVSFVSADIIDGVPDDCDDWGTVMAVQEQKEVAQFRKNLDEFKKKLNPFKEKDFIALFGESKVRPAKAYAMPVAEYRVVGLSGRRYKDEKLNKDHTDFYILKDVGALTVFYQIDGVTPAFIAVYFPTDKDFPKLTKDNLAKRLAWDEEHFKTLLSYCEKKKPEIFAKEKPSVTAPKK
jgi:hypothetical protein